ERFEDANALGVRLPLAEDRLEAKQLLLAMRGQVEDAARRLDRLLPLPQANEALEEVETNRLDVGGIVLPRNEAPEHLLEPFVLAAQRVKRPQRLQRLAASRILLQHGAVTVHGAVEIPEPVAPPGRQTQEQG